MVQLQVTFLQAARGKAWASAEAQRLRRSRRFCAEHSQLCLPGPGLLRAARGQRAGAPLLTRGMGTLAELAKVVQSSETCPLCSFSRVSQFAIKQTKSIFPAASWSRSSLPEGWCGATLGLAFIRDPRQCLVASAFRKGLLPSQSHLLGDLI